MRISGAHKKWIMHSIEPTIVDLYAFPFAERLVMLEGTKYDELYKLLNMK